MSSEQPSSSCSANVTSLSDEPEDSNQPLAFLAQAQDEEKASGAAAGRKQGPRLVSDAGEWETARLRAEVATQVPAPPGAITGSWAYAVDPAGAVRLGQRLGPWLSAVERYLLRPV